MADNRQFADHVELGGANVYFKEEPTTDTTMANTSYFKTVDADGNPVKISRDNIMGIVKDCLGSILNGLTNQETVTKIPTLNGNTLGASTAATLASVLGVQTGIKLDNASNSYAKFSINGTWESVIIEVVGCVTNFGEFIVANGSIPSPSLVKKIYDNTSVEIWKDGSDVYVKQSFSNEDGVCIVRGIKSYNLTKVTSKPSSATRLV